MKKKILALCLVVVLAVTAVTGVTLAYFTDTDNAKNTFVAGNVEIDQFELQRGANDVLEDFDNEKVVMPAVGDPAYPDPAFQWGDHGYDKALPGGNQLWADHMNAQDKVVFVENTGNNDVYYRTIIAYECPEGVILRTNCNNNERFDWNPDVTGTQDANNAKQFIVTVNGTRYEVNVATYVPVLTAGEISRPSLLEYALDKTTTQAQIELFNDDIEVLVFTEAVQADGFASMYTADTACNALKDAFGAVNDAYLINMIEGYYAAP